MPTTVNGYHLWQLPVESSWEPEEAIEFTELENDLGNGYYSQVLYGSNTGLRSWRLRLPKLAGLSVLPNTVTSVSGAPVSREQYVWDLYCETKVTGSPFVYQSQRNGQYYLVRFADKKLSYEKMKVQLYSTGIELKQVRIDGVTVFDPLQTQTSNSVLMTWLVGEDYTDGSESWAASAGGNVSGVGNVNKIAAGQNGLDTVRFNETTNDGYVANGLDGLVVNDAFLVMKIREASFSNAAGIFTGSAGGPQILLGSSGTTKFTNPALPVDQFKYFLNGLEKAQSDMQAPMNTWGLVQVRYTTGWVMTGNDFQFGRDRGTAGTYAEMEVGEIVVYSGLQPVSNIRETAEYLMVKWGILG